MSRCGTKPTLIGPHRRRTLAPSPYSPPPRASRPGGGADQTGVPSPVGRLALPDCPRHFTALWLGASNQSERTEQRRRKKELWDDRTASGRETVALKPRGRGKEGSYVFFRVVVDVSSARMFRALRNVKLLFPSHPPFIK